MLHCFWFFQWIFFCFENCIGNQRTHNLWPRRNVTPLSDLYRQLLRMSCAVEEQSHIRVHTTIKQICIHAFLATQKYTCMHAFFWCFWAFQLSPQAASLTCFWLWLQRTCADRQLFLSLLLFEHQKILEVHIYLHICTYLYIHVYFLVLQAYRIFFCVFLKCMKYECKWIDAESKIYFGDKNKTKKQNRCEAKREKNK